MFSSPTHGCLHRIPSPSQKTQSYSWGDCRADMVAIDGLPVLTLELGDDAIQFVTLDFQVEAWPKIVSLLKEEQIPRKTISAIKDQGDSFDIDLLAQAVKKLKQ